jgi:hypothetical protein
MNDRYRIPEFLRTPKPFVRVPIERPILFSAPMVRALLAGAKTQTRRVVKPQPVGNADVQFRVAAAVTLAPDGKQLRCPYGQPGDRLWVREQFSGPHYQDAFPPSLWHEMDPLWYWADGNPGSGDWTRPRPSIHMPRWASRILLEIVSVRVVRLQSIPRGDAMAEGCPFPNMVAGPDPREWFSGLWREINGPDSWGANPWVWVVEFRRLP